MANTIVPNFASGNVGISVWRLALAMISSGWTHLASSLGSNINRDGTLNYWNTSQALFTARFSAGNWILLQGPVTLRIPFITAPGSFTRGETISQLTSGATGELVGVVWDGSSSGYAVVMPMTGTFDNTHTISGNISSAVLTPNGTIAKFTRQVVFWINNITGDSAGSSTGHIYYQCTDSVGEGASQFSDPTRLAATTTTICPGGYTSGDNTFPDDGTGTFVVVGTGGSGEVDAGASTLSGCLQNSGFLIGFSQIMCANATPSGSASADGSFTLAIGMPGTNAGAYTGFSFQRLDATEPGDVENYGWIGFQDTPTRTVATSLLYSYLCDIWQTVTGGSNAGIVAFNHPNWRRRGMDSYGGEGGYITCQIARLGTGAGTTLSPVQAQATSDNERVATSLVTTSVLEPCWLVCTTVGSKVRKGTPRWIWSVEGNNGCDTYGGKLFVQLSNNNAPAFVAGPWDGVSVPSNA